MNFIASLLGWLFPCRHDHVTWPIKGRQVCLTCAEWRFYPAIGAKPSRWYRGRA